MQPFILHFAIQVEDLAGTRGLPLAGVFWSGESDAAFEQVFDRVSAHLSALEQGKVHVQAAFVPEFTAAVDQLGITRLDQHMHQHAGGIRAQLQGSNRTHLNPAVGNGHAGFQRFALQGGQGQVQADLLLTFNLGQRFALEVALPGCIRVAGRYHCDVRARNQGVQIGGFGQADLRTDDPEDAAFTGKTACGNVQ